MQRITSRQNATVAAYRDAARDASATILLDGLHLVGEAIDAGLRLRHVLIAADAVERPDAAALLRRLPPDTPVATASATVMDAASPVRSSSLIVALANRPPVAPSPFSGRALVVVLCDVQDPGNVGAILRVAEAAGATGAIVAGCCADPFGWKALRGSMGSALRLPIAFAASAADAVAHARSHDTLVVATVPRDGAPLVDTDLVVPVALLIGGEGPGLPADVVNTADRHVTIPMEAPVESLNAAVAAAIVLYEARRQRHSPALAHRGTVTAATT
ncbi:MAG: TrmH family RNA methyltransferase [Vicinamibacterales bacterium]